MRESWEQTRFITFYLLNPQLKHKMRKYTDLVKFGWEQEEPPEKIEFTSRQLEILKKWG